MFGSPHPFGGDLKLCISDRCFGSSCPFGFCSVELLHASRWSPLGLTTPVDTAGNGRLILQTGFFHSAFSITWMFISMMKLL